MNGSRFMKNLIFLTLFIVQSAVCMDVWSKIQQLIIVNPSPKQPAQVVKALPVLPSDIQIAELIKQLLEVATTRDQALTYLSSYVQVNKAIAAYVKNNKNEIQKLLDKKFGLSLTALASGNYDNLFIKSEVLNLLEGTVTISGIVDAIKNPQYAVSNDDIINAIDEIRFFFKEKKYNKIAAVLGVFNHIYTNNRFPFNQLSGEYLLGEFKKNMTDFGRDKNATTILTLLMQTIIKLFGTSFVNNTKLTAQAFSQDQRTLLQWALESNNKELINYLERIKKLG